MSGEYLPKDYAFRKADVIRAVMDSRGVPNDHEKEYDFIKKHRNGLSRLTRREVNRGEVLGTYPDIVEASLGMEEDMQVHKDHKSWNYRIISKQEKGIGIQKELVVYAKRRK